jgi:hypothetical protein
MQLTENQLENFFKKVNKTPGSCWIWTGCINQNGYGLVRLNKKTCSTHRILYEYYKGPIPEGLDIDHLCRVRNCVNPGHLEAVTTRVNILRGETIPSKHLSKTHCANGHPFTKENTYNRPNKSGFVGRRCKTCYKIAAKNHLLRKMLKAS